MLCRQGPRAVPTWMPSSCPGGGGVIACDGGLAEEDTGSVKECDDVDGPGLYIIKHSGTVVSRRLETGTRGVQQQEIVARLNFNSEVEVLEVVRHKGRVRGRIGNPAGWISLFNIQDGHRWARPVSPRQVLPTQPCSSRENINPRGEPMAMVSPVRKTNEQSLHHMSPRTWSPTSSSGPSPSLVVPCLQLSDYHSELANNLGRLSPSALSLAGSPTGSPGQVRLSPRGALDSSPTTAAKEDIDIGWLHQLKEAFLASGAGASAGYLAWRIALPSPVHAGAFPIVEVVPERSRGRFYKGDVYIVLESVRGGYAGYLQHHIYLWFGEKADVQRLGAAVGNTAAQSREVMNFESTQFRGLFQKLAYLDGTASASSAGLRRGLGEHRAASLLRIQTTKHGILEEQVGLSWDALNHGDCFVLDAGSTLYVWAGQETDVAQRHQAELAAKSLAVENGGSAQVSTEIDAEFWKVLGGQGPVRSKAQQGLWEQAGVKLGAGVLYRLAEGAQKSLEIVEVARSEFDRSLLDSAHIFVLDLKAEICLWIGQEALPFSGQEQDGFRMARDFLRARRMESRTPIHVYTEGCPIMNPLWREAFSH